MRARSIAVNGALSSAVAAFTLLIASFDVPLQAQQANPSAIPVTASKLPAEVQAKLDKMQTDLKAARAAGDPGAEAKILNRLGDIYYGVSAYMDALDSYKQALALAHQEKDKRQVAAALNGIGNCHRDLGQSDKATELYGQALEIATEGGDLKGQATALNGLGWVADYQGQFEESLAYHEKALDLARKANDDDLTAAILKRQGVAYMDLGERQKAVDAYNKALDLFRRAGDKNGEARTLINLGILHDGAGEQATAVPEFKAALPLLVQDGDRNGEAIALNNLGVAYSGSGDKQEALDAYKRAAAAFRETGNRPAESDALLNIGFLERGLDKDQEALDSFAQALKSAEAAHDSKRTATLEDEIGGTCLLLNRGQDALDHLQQALPLYRQQRNVNGEARVLMAVASAHDMLGDPGAGLNGARQALAIYRGQGNHEKEGSALSGIALTEDMLHDTAAEVESYKEAAEAYALAGEPRDQGHSLTNVGNIENRLGHWLEAMDAYNQARTAFRKAGDSGDEAGILNNIGAIYHERGELQKSVEAFNEAMSVAHAAQDPSAEAMTLSNLDSLYADSGQPERAIKDYEKALPAYRQKGDQDSEANALLNIGVVYERIGELQHAVRYCGQAAAEFHTTRNAVGEGSALNATGAVYADLGQFPQAMDFFNQALAVFPKDDRGQDETLVNIGFIYLQQGKAENAVAPFELALQHLSRTGSDPGLTTTLWSDVGILLYMGGRTQEGFDDLNRALKISRDSGNRAYEASVLNIIGDEYHETGDQKKAGSSFRDALLIADAIGDPLVEANACHGLMLAEERRQPSLAIFFGKRAVNLLQNVRFNVQGLGQQMQMGFLRSKEHVYRDLADLLIDEGRLSEAERVLDLLKEAEFKDFARGQVTAEWGQLALTATEQQSKTMFDAAVSKAAKLDEQWFDLNTKASRTPEEDTKLKQLSGQITEALNGLTTCYQQLDDLFRKPERKTAEETNTLQELVRNTPGAVGLYTLVGKDRYSIIVIRGSGPPVSPRQFAISEKDLNRKVEALRQALNDPTQNSLPAAQELYRIVVGPIADLLAKAHPTTLLWSLDGVLRYVPMAALNDGSRYLVEKYASVVISTGKSASRIASPDVAHLQGVGFGISRKGYEATLGPLPQVWDELFAVFRDPDLTASKGVVRGPILMNDQFTEDALKDYLQKKEPVVHIASHFVFNAGDDRGSYLLLAGEKQGGLGYELSLAELNSSTELTFQGTELLTLSACETGVGGAQQDGHEVDGLGTMAQLKGAQAVMASLWEVDDASTADLMGEFYRRWVDGAGKVEKAEALRQAQLKMLHDGFTPKPDPDNPNAPTSFTHPHYWAPFILMGNWK